MIPNPAAAVDPSAPGQDEPAQPVPAATAEPGGDPRHPAANTDAESDVPGASSSAAPDASPGAALDDDEPATPTERIIAEIWMEVLEVPRVGRRDNFFDLGGHSLLLTRVFSPLRERLGAHVRLGDLLQHRTVAELAQRLDQPDSGQAEAEAQSRAAARRAFTARAGALRAVRPPAEEPDDE